MTLTIVTATEAATPTVPPPAPAATATSDSLPFEVIAIVDFAWTAAESSTYALVVIVATRTEAPGATPTSPPIASEAAMPRFWKLSAAATSTDCAAPAFATLFAQAGLVSQLTCALEPIQASVVIPSTLTAPDRLTATDPEAPPLKPTAAMLSLFIAVTATPWKPPFVDVETVGWFSDEASADGIAPVSTRLCERPVAVLASSVMY